MAKALLLLQGKISLSEALEKDTNTLFQLRLVQRRADFFAALTSSAQEIEAVVAKHLAISTSECKLVNDYAKWLEGSFNVCIPLLINRLGGCGSQKVLIRIPLSYKVGEEQNPGNADEKLRSEAATYIWLQENCPTVPIPRLLGFGFPNGMTVR
jgi:hypothetical protein